MGPLMARYDVHKLKEQLPLVELLERHGVELERAGSEYKALCPFHSERTPSFTVEPDKGDSGLYYCMGCGEAGDQINFLQKYHRMQPAEAIQRLAELAGGAAAANENFERRAAPRPAPPPDDWIPGTAPADEPAPATLRVQRRGEWQEFPVLGAWPYRDATGALLAYDCRIEPEPGKKDIIPVRWKVNAKTGEARWKQGSLPKPRLLYGTELLAAHPDWQVLVVEGCKKCDAARRLLAGLPIVAVSWMGGSKAVRHADWSLLRGRKVVGWPDCDSKRDQQTDEYLPYQQQPGIAAMLAIAAAVAEHGATMRIIEVPPPGVLADGWDLADAEAEGWDQSQVMAYIRDHLRTPEQIMAAHPPAPAEQASDMGNPISEENQKPTSAPPAPAPDEPPPDPADYPPAPDYDDIPPDDRQQPDGDQPWRYLGCDRASCFYLPRDFPQVLELSAANHGSRQLMFLAPLHYWQRSFPSEKRSGDMVDWAAAANALIQRSKSFGVYRPESVRGRGAWWDDGRSAVHLGDRVVIDGASHSLIDVPSRFIYEARPAWPVSLDDPLSAADAVKLDKICAMPNWERSISGRLLAGFCMLAPICGALRYRPSIWITGESGSGKSSVLEGIVKPCVVPAGLFVASTTTEAGIRQDLGIDSLPVMFDEFDSETRKDGERTQEILKLLTQSATDSGAAIIKGGANGKSTHFRIRSMFCFSSITINIGQHAARTRISVLGLVKNDGSAAATANYNAMLDAIEETLTEEWIGRLHARAISLIPVIRHNAKVFAEAGAALLGMRRLGDQIGTLLAGCYALYSGKRITPEAAREWLAAQDWSDERAINEQDDGSRCLSHMMARMVRVVGDLGTRERSLGELVAIADRRASDPAGVNSTDANDTLRRHGIRIESGQVWIANQHPELARIMQDTAWANSWAAVLARLPGAAKGARSEKFAGAQSRYVAVPVAMVCD